MGNHSRHSTCANLSTTPSSISPVDLKVITIFDRSLGQVWSPGHRRYTRLLVGIALLGMSLSAASSQELETQRPGVRVSWAAHVATQYLWRGLELGKGPAIFPQLILQRDKLSATLYGAYTWDGNHREVDICLAYAHKGLTIGLNDYYFVSPAGESGSYFDYKNKHYIELYGTYQLSVIPAWVTLSSYIYGADRYQGRQAYSSYAELGYRYTLSDGSALSAHVGANINRGFYSSYERRFAVSTIGIEYSRDLKIGGYTIPLSLMYSINPHKEKSHITLGITFR